MKPVGPETCQLLDLGPSQMTSRVFHTAILTRFEVSTQALL